jgi:hypothetical protein
MPPDCFHAVWVGNIFRCESVCTRWYGNVGKVVGNDSVTDIFQIVRSEDKTNVVFDVREETSELGEFREDGAEGTVDQLLTLTREKGYLVMRFLSLARCLALETRRSGQHCAGACCRRGGEEAKPSRAAYVSRCKGRSFTLGSRYG